MDSAGVLKNDGKGKGCGYGVKCGVQDPVQGACPKGWHLPSGWEMESFLATVKASVDQIVFQKNLDAVPLRMGEGEWGKHLLDTSWSNGFDSFGFSALPAGYYISSSKKFYDLGDFTHFWSSTERDSDDAYGGNLAHVSDSDKAFGYSVRCLQD